MAVEKFPDEISTIRALLSKNPGGLTIRSISAMLGMNRNSAAKYMGMLQMQGSVTLKRDGSSKVYCLADRLPAAAVLKLTKSHVLLFDQSLTAVDLNDSLRDFLTISKEDIIGKTIDLLPLSVQSHPGLSELIEQGISGKESQNSAVLKIDDRFIPCTLTTIPVYYENGDNGVSVIIDCQPDHDKQGSTGTRAGDGINRTLIELDEIEYICQFGPDNTLTYVNNAYCGMMHKSRDELIGQNWQPAIMEKEFKKIQKSLASLSPKNPVQTVEFRLITPGGESRWQQWKFRGFFDNSGKVIQYQGTGLDISHLKKIEEQLKVHEQELEKLSGEHKSEILELNRQIYTEISTQERKDFQLQFTQFSMDNASYMIIWTTKNGQFVYMNKKAQEILGYPRRQLLTRKMDGILSAGTPLNWEETWKRIEQERNFTIESSFQTKDYRHVPVEIVFNYLEFKEKQYCCCFAKDITEKKQAEKAKQESERRFGVIFHSAFEFIALLQPDGSVVEVNDTALRFGGLTLSDVAGKPFWEAHWGTISTQTKVQLRNAIARAAGGLCVQYVVDVTGEGDKVATIDFSLKPVTDDAGMVTSLIAEGRDITERMHFVSALTVSEKRFHSLFETMLEGYAYCKIIYDREIPNDFVYIEVNSAFEKLTGLKNVAGKKVSEVIPGIHASNPELLRIYSRVALSGKTERFETYLSSLEYYLSITVYSQEEGYFTAVFENITGRRRAEDALKESEKKYHSIFDNAVMGIYQVSPEGRFLSANNHAARILGYESADELIQSITDINTQVYRDPKTRDAARQILREKGVLENFEVPCRHKDGHIVWVSFNARLVRDAEGNILYHEGTSQDITRRRQAEEVLRERIKELNCLYDMSALTEVPGISLDEIMKRTLLLLPPAWQFPEITEGRIVLEGQHFQTARFRESSWMLARDILVHGNPVGKAEVCYLDERPAGNEGPFLKEERLLLNTIAGRLGHIIERRQAEEALRHREHDFTTLVENATDMIVRFDTGLRYIYCNPAVECQLGIPFHQLAGKSPLEFGSSVEQGRFIVTYLQKTLETGREQEVEQPVATPIGLRHFLTRIVPERDTDGRIVSLLAITRDITDRRRAEEALQEKSRRDLAVTSDNLQKTEADLQLHQTELEIQNEELRQAQANLEVSRQRYFELYDLAPAGYLTLSEKGLILNANLTAAAQMGVDRQQLINKPVSRFIVPDDQDTFYHCRKVLMQTRERQSCELRMLHSGGTPFRVQVIAVPAPAVEGDEAAVSLMVIDSSELGQTDSLLLESIEIFCKMFESHDSVMLILEPGTGKILDANQAAEQFYGRSKNELCTLSIDEINTRPPEEDATLRAKAVRGCYPFFISRHRLASGEIRTVEVHSSPIRMDGKTVLFSIIHDITGREAGEREAAASRVQEHDLR